jgi:hypothetical protein
LPASSSRVPLSRLVEDHELYCANFLRIPTKQAGIVPFRWNRPQRMLARAVQRQIDAGRPIRIVVLKSRQVGISTWVQSFQIHRLHLRSNRVALTLAHEEKSALNLFDMQRRYYEGLPKTGPLAAPKRFFTRRQLQFEGTRSNSQVAVVGKAAGRSFTCHYLHLSELAFYENAGATMQAVKQGVPKVEDSAVFIESTPKGWGNAFHRVYRRAKSGKSNYLAVFIAWYDDPTCRMRPWFTIDELDEPERELLRLYPDRVDLEALAWRRDTIANECDGDPDVFREEYPSDDQSCFLTSGRPVFDKPGLVYQTQAVPQEEPYEGLPPPCEIEVNERKEIEFRPQRNGRVWLLKERQPRHQYVVGVDPSEGDPGSTASPIAVLDQFDLSFPALWYGRTPPEILAEHAVRLCRYFNDALLIWEANNHGIAFGMRVRELEYGNVYMRKVSDESVAGEVSDKAGYWTSQKARHNLVNTYRKYVREAALNGWPPIRHPIMVDELATLVYEEDKVVAQEGCLMDTVIAGALCLYAHRGNMDAPLEPLSEEMLGKLYSEVGWKLRMGILPRPEELEPYNVTAEELEKIDELVHNRDQARRRKGLGAFR